MVGNVKKIYLDTSVPNFIFADDALEKQAITKRFFQLIGQGKFSAFVSTLVDEEIRRAPREKQAQLNKVNPKIKKQVNQVNMQKGYSDIQIVTPEELVNLYA